MCPPPCGPRRSGGSRCYSSNPEHIDRSEAQNMSLRKDCIKECRPVRKAGKDYEPYTESPYFRIYDSSSKLRKVSSSSRDYKEGYETVTINTPYYDDVIVLRVPLADPTK